MAKKTKYTNAERRAYWIGVGYHAAGLNVRSDVLRSCMDNNCQISFVEGRRKADDLSEKFLPDYVGNKKYRK